MKKVAGVIFMVFLFMGAVEAANSMQQKNGINGYITVDRNVVVIPERLQWGDRIDMYDLKGAKVMRQYVGAGYLAADISNIPMGVYFISVYRSGKVIAQKQVSIR